MAKLRTLAGTVAGGAGDCGRWGGLKKDSSFSEEKEAKRLLSMFRSQGTRYRWIASPQGRLAMTIVGITE
jgi:hypothetical protein